jgi:hypothetical protein
VCESHSKQLGPSREHGPEARITTAESEKIDNPIQREDRSQTEEIPAAKSNGVALPEAASSPAGTKIVRADVAETKSNGAALPEAASSPAETKIVRAEVADTKSNGAALPEAASSPVGTKIARAVTETPSRTRSRDLTFGNSAKAMVDEAIWNLAIGDSEVYRTALRQGKSAREAARAAGGQLAVIHQKIGDYTAKLEAVLSESKATIKVEETIDKPLDQAVLEIIGDAAKSDMEKDAAIQQLGGVQKWIKHGLQGEMTAIQTNQILMAIGERLNWGGSSDVLEEFKPVYRSLYRSLKTAIGAAVPEAQNLHDRLTNLYKAKSDLDGELLNTKELTWAAR